MNYPPESVNSAVFGSDLIAGHPTFHIVTERISRIVEDKTRLSWWIAISLTGSLALLMFGMIGWLVLKGIGIWGVNVPIGWGFAISTSCSGWGSATPGR